MTAGQLTTLNGLMPSGHVLVATGGYIGLDVLSDVIDNDEFFDALLATIEDLEITYIA